MKKYIVALFVACFASAAFALSPINATLFGSKAIKGYDVVAYFTEGKAVKGTKQFTHEWKGATWFFANAENLATFMGSPESYAPQYGGYCAWAVSQGNTADIDPDSWKIVDGKLYLNYDADIQAKWAADIPGNIQKADGNWPGLLVK
jgi:YHS domain-containing protein